MDNEEKQKSEGQGRLERVVREIFPNCRLDRAGYLYIYRGGAAQPGWVDAHSPFGDEIVRALGRNEYPLLQDQGREVVGSRLRDAKRAIESDHKFHLMVGSGGEKEVLERLKVMFGEEYWKEWLIGAKVLASQPEGLDEAFPSVVIYPTSIWGESENLVNMARKLKEGLGDLCEKWGTGRPPRGNVDIGNKMIFYACGSYDAKYGLRELLERSGASMEEYGLPALRNDLVGFTDTETADAGWWQEQLVK